MKKKILFIPVGGTICTAVNDRGTLSVDEKQSALLVDNFENSDSPFAKDVTFKQTENLFILSENMTVDKWNMILSAYRENIAKDSYDGVIFAHGTDTLAYSAALFSILFAGTDIPIFFVSSNKKLGSEGANGDDNFRAAAECICRGIAPDVYVTYKNISDGKMYIHLASRLCQCQNYSEDFKSCSMAELDSFDIKSTKSKKTALPFDLGTVTLKERVLKLEPYVSINYKAYDLKYFSAVLHGTFHSGTACVQSEQDSGSILYLIDRCKEQGVDIYLSPSVSEGEVYDTVRVIDDNSKISFLYGMTNEMAYAKLIIAYSVFSDKKDIEKFIKTEWNNEYAY